MPTYTLGKIEAFYAWLLSAGYSVVPLDADKRLTIIRCYFLGEPPPPRKEPPHAPWDLDPVGGRIHVPRH